jgi:hypothetical protein
MLRIFFIYLLAICTFFLRNVFISFAYLLIGLPGFLVAIF